MTGRQLLGMMMWAGAFGLVIAFVSGTARVVSAEVWLAGFSLWLAVVIVRRLLDVSPSDTDRGLGFMRIRRDPSDLDEDPRPRELRALEGLLLRVESGRAYETQLRPRLMVLAESSLHVHHGIDPHADPGAAAAVLGDSAWLFDPAAEHRTPTIEQIESFVDSLAVDGEQPES